MWNVDDEGYTGWKKMVQQDETECEEDRDYDRRGGNGKEGNIL